MAVSGSWALTETVINCLVGENKSSWFSTLRFFKLEIKFSMLKSKTYDKAVAYENLQGYLYVTA